jgi:hypothetical protein
VVLPDAVALASVVDQLPQLVGRAELLFRDRATGDVIVARLQTRGASAAEDLFDTARIRPGMPSQVVSTASVSRAGLAGFDPIGSTP